MKSIRIVAVALVLAVPAPAGQGPMGPPKLESLHGTVTIMTGGEEGVAGEIWAKGNNTRVEIKDGERKVVTIQLGDTMYTYLEGSRQEGSKQHLGRGLGSMGLIKQIEEIKSRGKKRGSEEIDGIRYDKYEYDVNAPDERATVYLSPETSLPRIWVSGIKTGDETASLMRMIYRNMEANPYISDDMFRLPWGKKFSEEPKTGKPKKR